MEISFRVPCRKRYKEKLTFKLVHEREICCVFIETFSLSQSLFSKKSEIFELLVIPIPTSVLLLLPRLCLLPVFLPISATSAPFCSFLISQWFSDVTLVIPGHLQSIMLNYLTNRQRRGSPL